MKITTQDSFPYGRQTVDVFPKGEIETRASGLKCLHVKAINGCPFTDNDGGFGRSVFHGDMEFYAECEIFVTPSVESEFEKWNAEKCEAIENLKTRLLTKTGTTKTYGDLVYGDLMRSVLS